MYFWYLAEGGNTQNIGYLEWEQLARDACEPFIKLLIILLFPLYLIILGLPSGALRYRLAMQQTKVKNNIGEAPYLLDIRTSEHNDFLVIMEWFPCGIPLQVFEDYKNEIEAALNIFITKLSVDWRTHHIIIHAVFAKDVPTELVPWHDKYIPEIPSALVIGLDLAGEQVILDLHKIPHVLIGGSTGSGKSYALKLLLYQAVKKGYHVILADFKSGLDFLGPWETHCQMCLDKQQVNKALDSVCKELDRRKVLFRETQCRDIRTYHDQYPNEHLPRIVFACDEATAIFSKKQLNKEDTELTKTIEAKTVYIATQGRALGIHLMISVQRPDATVLDGQISNNIDYRICGRANQVLSQIILDQTDAKNQVPKDEDGFFLMSDGTLFRTYRIDDSSFWEI